MFSKRNAGLYVVAVILTMVVTAAVVLVVSELGFGTTMSTISAVLAFFTVSSAVYDRFLKPMVGEKTTINKKTADKVDEKEVEAETEKHSRSFSPAAKQRAERAENIRSNNDLLTAGNGTYPESTRKAVNWLEKYVPVEWEKIEALLFISGVGCGIWIFTVVMKLLASNGLSSPWWFHSLLQALPLAVEAGNMSELIFVPTVITLIVIWYFGSREQTTCEVCEVPFALKSLNRYYHPGNKYLREDTDEDGNPISWYEIDGHRVLYCESHGNLVARDVDWKED